MTRKIQSIGIIALLLLLGASTMAFAHESEPNDDRSGPGRGQAVASLVRNNDDLLKQGDVARLVVDPDGKFVASGLVVNSSSLTTTATGTVSGTINAKLFGINFTIGVNNARIEGGVATSTATTVAVGDKLSIRGSINPATGAIVAERIVDHTLLSRQTGDVQAKIAELLRQIEQLRQQLRNLSR